MGVGAPGSSEDHEVGVLGRVQTVETHLLDRAHHGGTAAGQGGETVVGCVFTVFTTTATATTAAAAVATMAIG